jgi:hypothetical protein
LANALRFLQEASANFAISLEKFGRWVRGTGASVAPGSVGNEFMRLLLRDYKGGADGDTYDTKCLKAKRAATAPGGESEVHIYEAYWADLARPKNSLLSFFFALFQLLLHVGSLSRLAIDAGAAENPGWVWRAFRAAQEYAVRILQIPIPLLNLILLIAAFSVLPQQLQQIPRELQKTTALLVAGLLGVVLGFLAWRKPARPIPGGPLGWAMLPLVFAGVGVLIGYAFLAAKLEPLTVAAVEWWAVGFGLFLYVLDKYEDIRQGTLKSGLVLYSVSFAAFVFALAMAGSDARLQQATLWTMQWLLAALRISWATLFVFAFSAFVLGSVAWRILPKGSPHQARARAAVRTSRLALALPALLVLLLVIFLWGGLFDWAMHTTSLFPHPLFETGVPPTLAPGGNALKSLFFDPAKIPDTLPDKRLDQSQSKKVPSLSCPAGHCTPDPSPSRHLINADNYFAGYLVWSIGPGLAITLVFMIASFCLLTWWALPSVLTEKFPLRSEKIPPRWSTNAQSLHMGSWTSGGLDAMAIVTVLTWCAIFLVPSIFYTWSLVQSRSSTLAMMNAVTDSIIGKTAGLTASLALLGLIVRYTSSALGIVLDVDNYLRTSPKDATPRAKIAERYVSLLRYIAKPEHGYTRVVIVAHSLGALISGDLLRFLHEEGDQTLERLGYGEPGGNEPTIPVTLFTMGNPVRQLMNRFFPFLYDWVNPVPSGSLRPFGAATLAAPTLIPANVLPDPSELGVQHWVNAYRSGDYVGRSLWVEEWYGRNLNGPDRGTPDEPVLVVRQAPLPQPSPREEMCIVAGAHQHYWDDTATDIAEQLNALI